MKFDPDDPRLTAYALGELDDISRHQLEAELAQDPAAAQVVEQIRAAARMLETELAREQSPGLGDARRQALIAHSQELMNRPGQTPVYHVLTHPVRRLNESRRLLAVVGIAAAVLVALGSLATLWPSRPGPQWGQAPATGPGNKMSPLIFPRFGLGTTLDDSSVFSDGSGLQADAAGDAPFVDARQHPISGFPLSVSTVSYSDVRRAIDAGRLPSREAVRIDEMVNAFTYHYPVPADDAAFAADVEMAVCPWKSGHRLVRIGLQARTTAAPSMLAARNVTANVEFNPAQVARYRLIGTVRPGIKSGQTTRDVTSGQAVTALYEVESATNSPTQGNGAMLTLQLHYRLPEGDKPLSQQWAINDAGQAGPKMSEDFQFAAAVASFGMTLRDPSHPATGFDRALALATQSQGTDQGRAQFIELVKRASLLKGA